MHSNAHNDLMKESHVTLGLTVSLNHNQVYDSLHNQPQCQHVVTYAALQRQSSPAWYDVGSMNAKNTTKRETDADGTRTHSLCHRKATRYHYATAPNMKIMLSYFMI